MKPSISMASAEACGSTFEKLDALAKVLASAIDDCEDPRNLPQLSRQYRETVRARDEYEPPTEDEISKIVGGFDAVR